MKKRTLYTCRGLTLFCAAALVMVAAGASFATTVPEQPEIDVVWSQSDGIRPEIFYTSRTEGSWSEPLMVTDDYYDNMHPVIDQDSRGTRWLFFTAYDNQRTEIRYTTGSAGVWEKSKPLSSEMKANSGPSVIIDGSDAVWVVWSAGDGGPDDIYFAVNKDGAWSGPQLLHEANDTPDTLPVISLNDRQQPAVSWQQLQESEYVVLTSAYDGSQWSEPVVVPAVDEQENENSGADMIVLPDFINHGGMIFIRAYQDEIKK